ncbi:MAG: SAM-dependent methyltransferase [Roseburia sp.]|nr:SAM-dependent methyltransferase [Roseburia sp.]
MKITNNNKLAEENIQNILMTYEKREDKQYYAAVVTNDKIAEIETEE